MAKSITKSRGFKPKAGRGRNAIALIFDLQGFSNFFNQPDVHEYVPNYLNTVIGAVESTFFGGDAFWLQKPSKTAPLSVLPVHRKFMGDGVLYVWVSRPNSDSFSNSFLGSLSNRLWNLKRNFEKVNRACADKVPVFELPTRIRFGLARGTAYELSTEGTTNREYIGFCINLASRLQSYCPDLGFIASARLALPQALLEKYGYIRAIATQIKGFPKEIVVVDKDEYTRLPARLKKQLFQDI